MTELKQEIPIWAKVAPIYSNHFTVAVNPFIVRVSFGEAFGSPESAVYHSAVSMVPSDAETLARSILDALEKDREARKVKSPEQTTNAG